jgi:hypothetical protein
VTASATNPRKRLGAIGIAGTVGGLLLIAASLHGQAAENHASGDWTHYVRIGAYGLKTSNAEAIVRDAQKGHVFGIEVDNDIPGRYESFLDPTEKLKAIHSVAEAAHAAGNKAFVYIAGTECITANADKSPHTVMKDHPEWVQRKLPASQLCLRAARHSGSGRVMKMFGSVRTRKTGGSSTWNGCDRSQARASTASMWIFPIG